MADQYGNKKESVPEDKNLKNRRVVLGEEHFERTNTVREKPRYDSTGELMDETRQETSPVFDDEKDRRLAKEHTKKLPLNLLKDEELNENPAAKTFASSDERAFAATQRGRLQDSDDEIIDSRPEDVTTKPRGPKVLTEREQRQESMRQRLISFLIGALIVLLLVFFAPHIQKALYQTNTGVLAFNPGTGITGPRAAVIEMLLGLLGIVLLISTFFSTRVKKQFKHLEEAEKKRFSKGNFLRGLSLLMILLIPVGFFTMKNFTEFRENDVRFSSFTNSNNVMSYDQVAKQEVKDLGDNVAYHIEMVDGSKTVLPLKGLGRDLIRTIDAKMPKTRNVQITTTVLDKLINQGIYTREEALNLFINK